MHMYFKNNKTAFLLHIFKHNLYLVPIKKIGYFIVTNIFKNMYENTANTRLDLQIIARYLQNINNICFLLRNFRQIMLF